MASGGAESRARRSAATLEALENKHIFSAPDEQQKNSRAEVRTRTAPANS
jgi:hypothetical protein